MTRLSADIIEFAELLFGDGRADVIVTVDGRAQLMPLLCEFADRACKMELDLACLEAIAAEIDPMVMTIAAGDAVLIEGAADAARRERVKRCGDAETEVEAAESALLERDLNQRADRLSVKVGVFQGPRVIPFPVIARPVAPSAVSPGAHNDNGGAA